MSSVVIKGDTSGQVTLTVPAVAGTNTATLPAGTGTIAVQGASTNIVSGTAVASTSGTSIDFTSIPSWVKKVTVMFNAVSTNGSSNLQVQIGSGSVTTSGYNSIVNTGASQTTSTAGYIFTFATASTSAFYGAMTITLLGSNTYTSTTSIYDVGGTRQTTSAGAVTLSGALDRVRVTTVIGTDTFDAGTINILYE